MTNATPNGSETISADEGKVVIEVLTCQVKMKTLNNSIIFLDNIDSRN